MKYSHGLIKNTNELILLLEEKRIGSESNFNFSKIFFYPAALGGVLIFILILGTFYLQKLYPIYNFCWGDYLEVFNKKESARKTINTVVIIGLIISIIGSIIANNFKF